MNAEKAVLLQTADVRPLDSAAEEAISPAISNGRAPSITVSAKVAASSEWPCPCP